MSRFEEGWEQFGVDKTLTQKAQEVKRQTKESPILPDFFLSASQSEVRVDLPWDEKLHRKIQRVRDKQEMMDLDLNNILVDGAPEKKVGGEFYQYTEEKVTAKILRELVDWLCCRFEFTYIDGLALYVYLDGQHVHFHFNFAARYLTEVFREYEMVYPLRSADYKEIVRLLQVQP